MPSETTPQRHLPLTAERGFISGDERPSPRRRRVSRTARILVSLAAVALIAVAAVGTSTAAESPASGERHRFCADEWLAATANRTVATLRAVGDCEIARRIVTLDALDARVAGADAFTDLHKDQLRKVNNVNPASYAAEKTGLLALKAKIDGETDLAALRADIARIAEDFRVYVLVVPKTHLVGGSDATDKAIDRLATLATRLQSLIDAAAARGKDVTAAQAALNDMKAKTNQADALVTPVVGTIMPLSPAAWNAGTAGPALGSARTTIQQARELLRTARADARTVIELLKG